MEYKGYTITVERDEHAESPRTSHDNLGTMICHHRKYTLGDDHGLDFDDCNSMEEVIKVIKAEFGDDCIMLPLYLYDHSGITMKTTPFSSGYDSGRLGNIVISRDKVRKEYSKKRITAKLKNQILTYLEGEVETYDQFLTGDVWGYMINKTNEENEDENLDGCWGFYGREYAETEAKNWVDATVNEEQKKEGIQQELDLVA